MTATPSAQDDGLNPPYDLAAEPFGPPETFEEAAARLFYLESRLTELDEVVAGTASSGDGRQAVKPGDEWEPYYGSLVEFVEEFFVIAFPRILGGSSGVWCTQWWEHAEAILRLEALWRTFEVARLEPVAGMADWLAGRVDHHLPLLTSITGPFGQCNPDAHRPAPPLPTSSAPAGWWDPMTHASAL